MFTLSQIASAHSNVKSGADFPAYIRELKTLGVVSYDAFVHDGHTVYFGADGFSISSPAKYEALTVSKTANSAPFKADLKAHQQGKTDYFTFCADCAKSGFEKWSVHLVAMTCTYFDRQGNAILVEQIPG
jgi:uncharacterized protein YbcV (DUF1398 family)